MAKIIPITEHFQHFVEELKESFWGDLYGRTRQAWKKFFELESERLRERYAGWPQYGRGARKAGGYRNGYYERGFATVLGTIRVRIARARGKSFSAARGEAVATPGAGSGDADPGSVSARAVDAASGPGGEHADRRSGERADRVAADSRPG